MKKKSPETDLHSLVLPPVYQQPVDHGVLILRDGSTATIRTAGPADKEDLRSFFRHLSPESRYQRFFSMAGPDEHLLDALCDPDPAHQVTLIAHRIVEGAERIIAAGSYLATGAGMAEVAMAVDDAFHGKGIGTLLLERLSLLAVRHGYVHFWATTHTDNKPMADIFRNAGFPFEESMEEDCLRFDFPVLPTQKFVEHSEKLDRVFTVASLRPFFEPKSIAVIGASHDPEKPGGRILATLIRCGFEGTVYPVNPSVPSVASVPCYRSAREIPEPVDLAIIVTPRDEVASVIDDCAARGVRAVMVVTAGYAESGPRGEKLQQLLLDQARGYGMRLLGPGSMGLMNTRPDIRLNGSYLLAYPPHGRVALSSQSGAVALVMLDSASKRQLGISTFVSVGNKADISGNDLLQYWENDPETQAILLYLESFGNPRRFARIARRVSRVKPIVCVKSNPNPPSGSASVETTTDALFAQTGVLRAETLDEMFDLGLALGNQPLPRGRNTGILTNAIGPAALCRDACLSHGLLVPQLKSAERTKLARLAAADINPVDLTYRATPRQYRTAVEAMLCSREIDSLIVIHVPFDPDLPPYVNAIRDAVLAARARGAAGKPVLACLMLEQNVAPIQLQNETIPTYLFPESAARVLAKTAAYVDWRKRPAGIFPDFPEADFEQARRTCQGTRKGWLPLSKARSILQAVGIPWIEDAPPDAAQLKIGVQENELFGPLLSFAFGGVQAEILGEVSLRITPLTDVDAADMLRRNRGFALLNGRGGTPAADIAAIERLLLQISRLVEEVPQIRELALDPVHATKHGCSISHARVRIA